MLANGAILHSLTMIRPFAPIGNTSLSPTAFTDRRLVPFLTLEKFALFPKIASSTALPCH